MRNHRKSNNRQEWVRAEPHRRWAETLVASWSTCGSVASCSRASPWCNVVEVSSVSYEPVIKEAHTATFSPAHLLVILSFLEQPCFFFSTSRLLHQLDPLLSRLTPSPGQAHSFPSLGLKYKCCFQKHPLLYLSCVTHLSRHPVLFLPNTTISYYILSIVLSTLHVLADLILTTILEGRHYQYLPLRGEETGQEKAHISWPECHSL